MKRGKKNFEIIPEGKKRYLVKNLTNIIFPYSPKNNKAKIKPLYSVLKPETSSLSPSAKSKGERLVSATILMIHKGKITKNNNKEKENLSLLISIVL